MRFVRHFSNTVVAMKPGYSSVQPVHHLVPISKTALKPGYKELLVPKDDITSVGFKPTETRQDRVAEYFENSVKSDLMLHFYDHNSEVIEGNKRRSWGTDSPYKLYRNLKKPKGVSRPTRDIHPITNKNIPQVTSVVIQAFEKNALEESWLNISTRLQLAQITNVKPKQIFARANILPWRLREGKPCGAKVELFNNDMNQFISTLTEIVLPRIRTFRGIKNTSGDNGGNITFGLNPEDVKNFPEIENFQELFPNLTGMHITFKTTARTDEQARTLISTLGFPFFNP
jgi:large subunit ribosomal protein L5